MLGTKKKSSEMTVKSTQPKAAAKARQFAITSREVKKKIKSPKTSSIAIAKIKGEAN
jgi:hypothetical protein